MFSLVTLLGLLQLLSVRADPTPLEPSSNSVFNEGGQCTMQWTPDPTGVWTVMNIELMTGSNQQMVHLRTVGTVDGTSATANSYSYPCLAVEPNSQIYFYQFTSPNSNNVTWTTRFTIADATGKTVPPELTETNSAGEIVRYGIGKLENQSLVDAPPPRGNVTSPSASASASASVNGTSTSVASSTPPPNSAATPTSTLTRDVSPPNDGSDSNSNSTTSAAAAKSSQSQNGSAISCQRSAGVGILAAAVLCGSLLL